MQDELRVMEVLVVDLPVRKGLHLRDTPGCGSASSKACIKQSELSTLMVCM